MIRCLAPLARFQAALVVVAMAIVAMIVATGPASAVQPDEMLDDPALEARAREVSKDLRCVVCQNESIDDSNAELAHDMRLLVRERIIKGDTNAEAKQFMVDRYGDYVLLRPPFKAKTYALWFGPAAFLLLALVLGWRYYRRPAPGGGDVPPAREAAAPLSAEEERRLKRLLTDDGPDGNTLGDSGGEATR